MLFPQFIFQLLCFLESVKTLDYSLDRGLCVPAPKHGILAHKVGEQWSLVCQSHE